MRIEACWAFEAMFLCAMWPVAHAATDAGGKLPMAKPPMNTSRYAYPGPDGRLVYPELDEWGNRLPDYSYTGYEGAGPRVYLDCLSEGNQGGPGPHLGFVNGDLFDNVRSRTGI